MGTFFAEEYQGADGQFYRVARTGKDDTSQVHATYPTGYDARCSFCWFGFAHSENLHKQKVES